MLKALWNRINKDEQGFTMVELLIVIVILGVLAGIGIPTYRGFVTRAHEAATLSELQAVSMAIKYYDIQYEGTPGIGDLRQYLGEDLTEESPYVFLDTYTLTLPPEADYILATAKVGEEKATDRLDAYIYLDDVTVDSKTIRKGDIVIVQQN